MVAVLVAAGEEDIVNDLAALNEALLEQAVTQMVHREVQGGRLSIRDVVMGLCRIGSLSLVVGILTGMKEPGIIIAVVGVWWLYSRL
jgi:hypothetical protein